MTPLLLFLISWITVFLYYLPALLDPQVDIEKYKIFVFGLYLISGFLQSAWMTTLTFVKEHISEIDGFLLLLPALVSLSVHLLAQILLFSDSLLKRKLEQVTICMALFTTVLIAEHISHGLSAGV